jgi:hypothetical protein
MTLPFTIYDYLLLNLLKSEIHLHFINLVLSLVENTLLTHYTAQILKVVYGGKHSLFVSQGSAAQRGPWPPHSRGFLITQNDAPQSVGLLLTSDQLVAETAT